MQVNTESFNSDHPVQRAARLICERAGVDSQESFLHTAVILGSGLGAAGERAINLGGISVPYEEIPGMPQPAVAGHAGRMVLGTGQLGGVALMQGRVHYYEGHSLATMLFAVELLAALGVRRLIVTNAAGGITAGYQPGDLMMITGHWSFLNVCEAGNYSGRSSAAEYLWNRPLLEMAKTVKSSLTVHQGVYAMMSGPNYETPAEVRMLRTMGVDAVGMSTVPEAMAAARRGIEVLGVSCITNIASGLSEKALDHAEVSETAGSIETEFTQWLFDVLSQAADGNSPERSASK